ncbi:HTH-type transcriptional regulator CymR [Aquisphaera giovannonii]|uniref:HTH-type transcriptional regulator CymR n=1 Tax=Aquisphaera giovannonii TaxID=406548 RepID=A0A5B9WAX1_9BACT|nr:Rrf2 family transcriptional regulator [Aquisphaera giovannonii]QEH37726.1 HTH-type transcriptional regulator CymR [Aquisphaera giovannonii]
MRISAKAEYACLALLALAQSDRAAPPLRIREIAGSRGIPERYLVQILLQLKGAGLVASTRGASGGYRLARPAAEINLRQVLSAIDGPDVAPRDAGQAASGAAHAASAHILAGVWEEVRQAERNVLERTTLAQLAAQAAPQDWII